MTIAAVLDLDRYPLDRADEPPWRALAERCRAELAARGLVSLPGLMRPDALTRVVAEVTPLFASAAFTQSRRHNIYFRPSVPGLAQGHPALTPCTTVNHTLCADQLAVDSVLLAIYAWSPFAAFLAAITGNPRLFPMADPLARVIVTAYRAGDELGWHFDRADFTTTLLLQAPEAGGTFQYRSDLRADDAPNYDGVAALLQGRDPAVKTEVPAPGTLTVFRGKNTAHRVTPVQGGQQRLMAVLAYCDRPGVLFTTEERLGFFGRAA